MLLQNEYNNKKDIKELKIQKKKTNKMMLDQLYLEYFVFVF